MEIELCKGEIQAYCNDVLDYSLALIRSALSIKDLNFITNNIELTIYNQEQLNILDKIINDVMFNFTNYYYASADNYVEHPYYMEPLVEGDMLYDYNEKCIEGNPLFKLEYENISDAKTKILFSIKDKEKCIQALNEYLSNYCCDCIYNDEANILTRDAQDKQLYELLAENDYNLCNFVVNDIKYLKAICYNEYQKKITIGNISLDFDASNKLTFKCIINASEFVEDYGKSITIKNVNNDKPKKHRQHFAPSIQVLYDYLKKYAPAKNYEIYKSDLIGEDRKNKLYCGMGELTTAVNRLNEQYKEISNTDITLMKYDKFLDCYTITNIWKE